MTTTLPGMMPLLAAFVFIGLAGVLPRAEAHSAWEGTWKLSVGKGGFDRSLKCGREVEWIQREFKVELQCPDYAVDEFGNEGHWVSIFDVGVEIVIQGRKFYSFPWKRFGSMNATKDDDQSKNSTRDVSADRMPVGWSHDVVGNNWACFSGLRSWREGEDKQPKKENPSKPLERDSPSRPLIFKQKSKRSGSQLFRTDHDLISAINQAQSFWTAEKYPQFENLTMDEMINLAGGKQSRLLKSMKVGNVTEEQKNATWYLPKNWDWRNVKGQNYVTPIRNQGRCGSCYAFAATAMHESRVRILTNNKVAQIYSPQDLVDCSPYAFGCGGGYLFSEAKYGEEYGYAEESCNTYKGSEYICTSLTKCQRSYATDYEFIRGHWGCNDLAMQLALYMRGPIVVGYIVFQDFFYYKTGIYYHYGPNYFMGRHAVTVVGWGEDEKTGTKYWIVKNSWGSNWGEDGYFRIIRGLNEVDIEASAWQSSPIL